jgi:glutathionyl-hydroquinone reductase
MPWYNSDTVQDAVNSIKSGQGIAVTFACFDILLAESALRQLHGAVALRPRSGSSHMTISSHITAADVKQCLSIVRNDKVYCDKFYIDVMSEYLKQNDRQA